MPSRRARSTARVWRGGSRSSSARTPSSACSRVEPHQCHSRSTPMRRCRTVSLLAAAAALTRDRQPRRAPSGAWARPAFPGRLACASSSCCSPSASCLRQSSLETSTTTPSCPPLPRSFSSRARVAPSPTTPSSPLHSSRSSLRSPLRAAVQVATWKRACTRCIPRVTFLTTSPWPRPPACSLPSPPGALPRCRRLRSTLTSTRRPIALPRAATGLSPTIWTCPPTPRA
mmetsp:Transcript_1896/g.6771  ORF Transcript_1896/g.6771 Transcript_1896/m.6771 type:complete len:229 (+) Transcript_1896:689-1375(+)